MLPPPSAPRYASHFPHLQLAEGFTVALTVDMMCGLPLLYTCVLSAWPNMFFSPGLPCILMLFA